MAEEIKYVRATIASFAGIRSGTDITSYDDQSNRHLTGIFVSPSTANVAVDVLKQGDTETQIDGSCFNATAGFLDVNETFMVGQYFHVDIENNTGGSVGPFYVTLRYGV